MNSGPQESGIGAFCLLRISLLRFCLRGVIKSINGVMGLER